MGAVSADAAVVVRVVERVMVRVVKAGGCHGAVRFEGGFFRVCKLLDGT